VAPAGLLVQRLLEGALLPRLCDSTFIWQGYKERGTEVARSVID